MEHHKKEDDASRGIRIRLNEADAPIDPFDLFPDLYRRAERVRARIGMNIGKLPNEKTTNS